MAVSEDTRYVVGPVDELPPGTRRELPIGRTGVGLFNVDGVFYALGNSCPHMGGPLCAGRVTGTTQADGPYRPRWVREGEILRCPWHGWEFDLKTGETVTKPVRRVRSYPVVVEDGMVIIDTERRTGNADGAS
jgi:nitrite reductase/ring-hydroxylating ferredoxin subunit